MKLLASHWFPILLAIVTGIVVLCEVTSGNDVGKKSSEHVDKPSYWRPPSISELSNNEKDQLILYGRDLIVNTAAFLGPKGSVMAITNGMNCQNCHLNAGATAFANCFASVAAIYPTYRPRSGVVESITFRVNDCLQRSLNGKTIDSNSREMRAMVAYLEWVGKDVPKGKKLAESGTQELVYLDRAADPAKGKILYTGKCQSCHGVNGEGLWQTDSAGFIYPPLWGDHSYNTGAGLHRLTRMAGYIRYNMPFGASYDSPQLSDDEAWDLAAFINSQPRPHKPFPQDWPKLSEKAIDFPFGPYADRFTEQQHKYGPFAPIKKSRENVKMR